MITRKFFITILCFVLASSLFGQTSLNPTGTYTYKGKTLKYEETVYGPYTGTIQVKQIAKDKIVMTFYICKGAPSYNLGSFVDTLQFLNNTAIYTDQESDSTCSVTFNFDKKGVTVKEATADDNFGCGFGHAVVAHGRFKKKSSKQPVLRHPLTDEVLK